MAPSKQQEITELLSKIRDAQDSQKRAKLLEELNGLQPPISALPPEILSLIFQYVFHVPHKSLYRSISLVSKRWRRILVNTPDIWTTIDFDITASPHGRLSLLPFIINSGDRDLSLMLRFHVRLDDKEVLVDPIVDPCIIENFERIRNLDLTNPPMTWFSQFPRLQRMQHLTLKSHQGHRIPTNIPVDRIPSVSELTLIDLKSVQLTSTCSNITTLTLTHLRITTSVRIFTKCPNLKKLHLEYLDRVQDTNFFAGVDGEDSNFPAQTITLQHLEIFEWIICKPGDIFVLSWQSALIHHLNLPSLRSLKWEDKAESSRFLPAFFNRLALTLTEVEFLRWDGWSRNIFLDEYQIESIVFSDCGPDFVDGILQNVKLPSRLQRLKRVTVRRGGRLVEGPVVQRHLRLLKQRVGGGGMVFNDVPVL